MSEYYVKIRGQVKGPFDRAKVLQMIRSGQVGRFHEFSDGGENWTTLSNIPELAGEAHDRFSEEVIAHALEQESRQQVIEPKRLTVPAEWYYGSDGQSRGPVTVDDLLNMAGSGGIHRGTLVWRAGMETWQPLSLVRELHAVLAAANREPRAVSEVHVRVDPTQPVQADADSLQQLVKRHMSSGYGWVMFCGIALLSIAGCLLFLAYPAFAAATATGVFLATQAIFIGILGTMAILLSQCMNEVRQYGTADDIKTVGRAHARFWLTLSLVIIVGLIGLIVVLLVAFGVVSLSLWPR